MGASRRKPLTLPGGPRNGIQKKRHLTLKVLMKKCFLNQAGKKRRSSVCARSRGIFSHRKGEAGMAKWGNHTAF